MALAIRLGSNKHIAQAISARSPVAAINTIVTQPAIHTVTEFDEFTNMANVRLFRYFDLLNYAKCLRKSLCTVQPACFKLKKLHFKTTPN